MCKFDSKVEAMQAQNDERRLKIAQQEGLLIAKCEKSGVAYHLMTC
jgi:hypothetical protein